MSPSQRFGAGSFFFFNSKGLLLLIKKEQGALTFQKVLLIPRDLDGIQTHDLQNRNLTLYSAKLRDHFLNSGDKDTKNRAQNKTNPFVFYAEMEYLRQFSWQRYEKFD